MYRRFLIVAALLSVCLCAGGKVSVVSTRVQRLGNPTGLSPEEVPVFSWILESDKPGTVQTAYEVKVTLGGRQVWTSGRVESDNSTAVPYGGPLSPFSRYDWSVRVWDNHGCASKPVKSSWTTGPSKDGWQASWIGVEDGSRPIYLSNEFVSKGRIRSAQVYVSARGIYQASLNGRKIGDDLLTPGWTAYRYRVQYQAYDVTDMLVSGRNSIVATVSQGWYGSGLNWRSVQNRYRYGLDEMLLFQLRIEYTDGRVVNVVSDGSWKMSYGPVSFAGIYDGQTTDANVAFDWKPVSSVRPCTASELVPTANEPVRRRMVLKPVSLIHTPEGDTVIDFGQNIVGWERVRLKGEKGDTVVIRHAEVLDRDGNFYTTNLRRAKATSTYVLSGGEDVFEPVHTFYGFRYISVKGLRGDIDLSRFEAVHVCSGFDDIGEFECSDSLINRLHSNIDWSFHDNFVDVPTDCPQRDERLGWTGDAQVFFRTATFLGRVENFFRKWLADLALDQRPNGMIPRVIPDTFPNTYDRSGATGWADCATLIPWQHYMAFGDGSVLEAQYASMKAWIDWCIGQAKDTGWLLNTDLGRHFGDWLFWSKNDDRDGQSAVTSRALIAQAFFAAGTRIVAQSAEVLGLDEDAAYYSDVDAKVREAFLNEYVTPSGLVSSDTQTAYVLALHFDLLPERLRAQAARRLVENIHRYKDHISTGFLGTPYICEVLTDYGYSDVAYTLLMQKTCPGWLYSVTKGATTMWERWNSITEDGTILEGMNSFNHYSFGAVGDWLYRSALGIRESSPGYRTVGICPHAGGGITHMKGATVTPYGRLAVEWTADSEGHITSLDVDVPVGVTAKICLEGQCCETGSGHWSKKL